MTLYDLSSKRDRCDVDFKVCIFELYITINVLLTGAIFFLCSFRTVPIHVFLDIAFVLYFSTTCSGFLLSFRLTFKCWLLYMCMLLFVFKRNESFDGFVRFISFHYFYYYNYMYITVLWILTGVF